MSLQPISETHALLTLRLLNGIGDKIARLLINQTGSAVKLFELSKRELSEITNHSLTVLKAFQDRQAALERAQIELDFCVKNDIEILHVLDENYPSRLRHCEDAPFLLFKKGVVNLNTSKVIAIVGTRNATNQGKQLVEHLLSELASMNVLVISGLAHGIDGVAHRSALDNNLDTVAVVAHGLDRIYPSEHRKMAHEMLERGGWISDYFSGTNPDRGNFPERNRIIAGLSDAVIVVESKRKGGSMITAEIAYSYNRDVFAFPGRPTDPLSEGCNYLIKSKKAVLIDGAEDLCREMNWSSSQTESPQQTSLLFDLNPEENLVVTLLREQGKLTVDELSIALNMPVHALSVPLLNLELHGILRVLPGKVCEII